MSLVRAAIGMLLLVSVGFGACAKKDEPVDSTCWARYTPVERAGQTVDLRREVVPVIRRACSGADCHADSYKPAASLYLAPKREEFRGAVPPACGDTRCGSDESPATCPLDCTTCGDGVCGSFEVCAADCGPCGDGACGYHETMVECAGSEACTGLCGNGTCGVGETTTSCPDDCDPAAVCGDGSCRSTENSVTCPDDCGTICPADCAPGCGDYTCDAGESPESCPRDCLMLFCGDGDCAPDENAGFCPVDCGTCGDGVCGIDEACACDEDCPEGCGNGLCEEGETSAACPLDCLTDEYFTSLVARLVNVPSKTAAWPDGSPVMLIEVNGGVGDPSRSFFMMKLEGSHDDRQLTCEPQDTDATGCGDSMPDVTDGRLSEDELTLFRDWITQGARDSAP